MFTHVLWEELGAKIVFIVLGEPFSQSLIKEEATRPLQDGHSQLFPSLKLAFLLGFDGVLALECGLDDGAECVAPPPPPPPPPPLGDMSNGEP